MTNSDVGHVFIMMFLVLLNQSVNFNLIESRKSQSQVENTHTRSCSCSLRIYKWTIISVGEDTEDQNIILKCKYYNSDLCVPEGVLSLIL